MTLNSTGSTILIVDDELVIRETLERLLTAEGYELAFAVNGAEALAKAAELTPDLILLDVVMPGMDGFQVCRRLRADRLLAEVPVVMLTALDDHDSRLQGLEAGADDFVSKPFDELELMARVRTITQLNRYRLLLSERAKFERIIELSPNGIMIVDADGTIRLANPAMLQMLGAELEGDIVGKKVQALVVAEQSDGFPGFSNGVVADVSLVEQVETSFTRLDGECFPVQVDAGHMVWDGRSAVQIIVRDITQRRRAEETLRRRNEELMALNAIATTVGQSLDLNRTLNASLDKVLEVMEIDAGWVQLLNDASSLSLVAHCGFPQEIVDAIGAVKLREGMAAKVARSEQSIVLAEATDAPKLSVETGVGEALHAIAGVPIVARRKLLGVLTIFSYGPRELTSQEVQLLTAIGHQIGVAVENLRLAKETADVEMLRELDRLRSELIANVSHELRTPLGLVKVFCTTLLREDVELDRETQKEFLLHIDDETEKLEKIVDNLLDLSHIESGRLHLDKHPTDVGRLAREVVETMEIQLTQHNIVFDLPSDPLMATVDPKRIEQVLRNLLSNAIKYSPEGGTITVQGRGDKRQLLIWVSDQGIGIPPQDFERVFERFYRVENEVTQSVRGAGLGLAVSRGIVEAHGGRVWAESTPGVGTTFYVSLPGGIVSESCFGQPQW